MPRSELTCILWFTTHTVHTTYAFDKKVQLYIWHKTPSQIQVYKTQIIVLGGAVYFCEFFQR